MKYNKFINNIIKYYDLNKEQKKEFIKSLYGHKTIMIPREAENNAMEGSVGNIAFTIKHREAAK